MKDHSEKGFSLVELMITVSIIGVLAATAIPTFQSYFIRTKAVDGTLLLGDLADAQVSFVQTPRTDDNGNIMPRCLLIAYPNPASTPTGEKVEWIDPDGAYNAIGFYPTGGTYFSFSMWTAMFMSSEKVGHCSWDNSEKKVILDSPNMYSGVTAWAIADLDGRGAPNTYFASKISIENDLPKRGGIGIITLD